MKKKHHPVHNLGAYAHAPKAAPKASQNFAKPTKAQTQSNTMKLIGKVSRSTGKKRRA